jgi:hypothetical protein
VAVLLRQPRTFARRVTAAVSERRVLAAPMVLVLVAVAGGCWAVTVERIQGMDMGPGTDLGSPAWFAVVWVTMMAAMMLPSVSPIAVASSRTVARTVVFAVGYLLTWFAFGVLAYAVVEGVRSLDLGFLVWNRVGHYLAGGVILLPALYELTAAKTKCLRHFRDVHLLHRRQGVAGALLMGVEQGGYCVGCSGALMAGLFAPGVMSIAWIRDRGARRDREASALELDRDRRDGGCARGTRRGGDDRPGPRAVADDPVSM